MDEYLVYIRVDDAGRVVGINSSAFLADTEGWVEIDRATVTVTTTRRATTCPGRWWTSGACTATSWRTARW